MMRLIATWLSERVAHFLWGRENATVPGLTPSSVSMVNTKCCPGPVLTSIWGQDYKYKQSSSLLINKSMSDLFIKIPGVDNGPVGHGERVTGTLGHLHPPTRHCSGQDACFWNLFQVIIHSSKLWFRQSVDFGGTSNCKNLKISVFGCFRVNLLEFGFRKYDLRKFGKLCNLLFLFL